MGGWPSTCIQRGRCGASRTSLRRSGSLVTWPSRAARRFRWRWWLSAVPTAHVGCWAPCAGMGKRLRQLGLLHPPNVTVHIIAAVFSTAVRFGVLHHELPLAVAYRSGWSGRALLAGRFHTILSSQLL